MQGYFLPYQLNWLDDPSTIRVWEKSRRVGATYVQSFEDVRDCIECNLPKGNKNIWFSAQDEDSAREYINYCEMWTRLFADVLKAVGAEIEYTSTERDYGNEEDWEIIDSGRDIKVFEIIYNNGCKISVLSSNPSRFRGKGGKVVLDEFAYHPDPGLLWRSVTPCTTWGGRIVVLSTHDEPNNFFCDLINDINSGIYKEGEASVHKITIYDAVEQGLVEKINEGLPDSQKKSREEFIEFEKRKIKTEAGWYKEYCCEPRTDVKNLAVKGFSDKNIANVEYKPVIYNTLSDGTIQTIENPVYLFCDFNRAPNCWGLGHIYNDEYFAFKEYCEDLYTGDLINLILNEYPLNQHEGLIIINGDASGHSGSSKSNATDYKLIENALIDAGFPQENHFYNSGKRFRRQTSKSNGNKSKSFAAFDAKMCDINKEPHFFVNPHTCPKMVYAFENLKHKPGTYDYERFTEKEIDQNPILRYLEHITDAARYWVATNSPIDMKYTKVPPKPLTPVEQWEQQVSKSKRIY